MVSNLKGRCLYRQASTNLSTLYVHIAKLAPISGNVPIWIGDNLSTLYVLILKSNNFSGTVPLQLCQLEDLQILDLSMNHLHGTIPSCLDNLTSMVQEGGFLQTQNVHYYWIHWFQSSGDSDELLGLVYVDHAMIEWQGYEREFFSNLIFVKMIDLSSNNLTGQIPDELINLHELVALNLSKNALHGEIPQKIGQMQKLLSLGLSRNNLSGRIPSSISQMSLLNDLDVSFNNLSGRIPKNVKEMKNQKYHQLLVKVRMMGKTLKNFGDGFILVGALVFFTFMIASVIGFM